MKFRFPRKAAGWRRLFWLTLRRCPTHHRRLSRVSNPPDDQLTHFCFDCPDVSMWPVGFFKILYLNWLADYRKKEAARSASS